MQAAVAYTLDASDAVIAMSAGWTAFAAANNGAALLPPSMLGRSIWDFITDSATTQIYRRLFERVHSGGGPVRLAFRCDSPWASA